MQRNLNELFALIPPPFMRVREERLSPLSADQYTAVADSLSIWRRYLHNGTIDIKTDRIAGQYPTWAEWSGCPWVLSNFKAACIRNDNRSVHILTLMHHAIPPHCRVVTEDDFVRHLTYGFWQDSRIWIPPHRINGSGLWVSIGNHQ